MPWQLPVVLRLVTAYVITSILLKKITGLPSRTRRLRDQFLMCALFSVVALVATRSSFVLDRRFFLIVGLGFIGSFAAYAQWRATDLSLSKTALFTSMDDVISMILAFIVLGENRFMTPLLAIGIMLCLGAAVVNVKLESRSKVEKERVKPPWHIFVWIGIYSLVWGVAFFAIRIVALVGIPLPVFLVGWYGGAFIGANAVMLGLGKNEMGESLTRKGVAGVSLLSLAIFVSLALNYWASMHAPVSVTQPIFQVAEMVLPALIGLFLFKESKELSGVKKFVFSLAFIGSLIVAMSY